MHTSLPPADRTTFRLIMATLLTGSCFCLTSAIAMHLYTQHQLYEAQRFEQIQQGRIDRAEVLKADQRYLTCIAEIQQIPSDSLLYSQAQTVGGECQSALTQTQLQQAQHLADAGYFQAAIVQLQTITDESAALKVQQLLWEWSNRILQIAETYYRDPNNRYAEAMQIAQAIGATNPLYETAQSKIAAWQTDWSTNQAHFQRAAELSARQHYQAAKGETEQISHAYWQQKAAAIVKQSNDRSAQSSTGAAPLIYEVETAPNGLLLSVKFLLPLSLWSFLTHNRKSR